VFWNKISEDELKFINDHIRDLYIRKDSIRKNKDAVGWSPLQPVGLGVVSEFDACWLPGAQQHQAQGIRLA